MTGVGFGLKYASDVFLIVFQEIFIREGERSPGPENGNSATFRMCVTEQAYSIKDYYTVTNELSVFFGVSRISIEYRLRGLDLVQKSVPGVKTVEEILRGISF
ncbi:hypothetical protein CLV42_12613 [Chitinophaga ginsengisoli]|uniref:Uncharacterized protein n=1 Tax=Chitinophaga ginsengisoli TaxID=363837 RepID=A0A2P8FDV5_9BACT|nr:hypothetical protein CLV42_12613 [Chitinophaga ginsengisoli]